ncbi:NUDIX hydrolase [Alteribacter keqinensis]|uniref:NUDIX domain-containing protein n=1 Tax=Alteribacter keqinensis TaxID=2483800 RepID=A0A3M7TSH0_9BACI|nr:NUDIX domain-containing protein [Alteribacter keqinensis]RNA68560.1 NUDIX domain-containing protein [Alteribacter keqinensis]
MNNQIHVNWDGHEVNLTWLPMKLNIDYNKVTSVRGICFSQEKILLVNVKDRCFNIPGGHIEKGETPEEAFQREVHEEGYVKGVIQYIGAIEVSHENNPLFIPDGKYHHEMSRLQVPWHLIIGDEVNEGDRGFS